MSRSPSQAFPQTTWLKARFFSGQFHQNHAIDLCIIRKNKTAKYPRTPWIKVDQCYFPITPQLSHDCKVPLTPSLVPHRGAWSSSGVLTSSHSTSRALHDAYSLTLWGREVLFLSSILLRLNRIITLL